MRTRRNKRKIPWQWKITRDQKRLLGGVTDWGEISGETEVSWVERMEAFPAHAEGCHVSDG